MHDVLALVRRDFRLHRAGLILPVVLGLLWAFLPYLMLANEPAASRARIPVDLPLLALAVAPLGGALWGVSVHLRESQHQTIASWLTLPVSPARLLLGRWGTILAGTLGLMALVLLEGVLVQTLSGSHPILLPGRPGGLMSLAWTLMTALWLLPPTLRWDGKGLLGTALGFALLSYLPGQMDPIAPGLSAALRQAFQALHRIPPMLDAHPVLEACAFVLAGLGAFFLGRLALTGREA